MDSGNHHIKKYLDYHEKYKEKYGENTVVLMQAGSHFNIFAIINDEVNIGPDIYHICQNVLNKVINMDTLDKISVVIRMQNIYLLKYIAYNEGWSYINLCKKFLK